MLTKLLKTTTLFWLAAPTSFLNAERSALKKETPEEIDRLFNELVKAKTDPILQMQKRLNEWVHVIHEQRLGFDEDGYSESLERASWEYGHISRKLANVNDIVVKTTREDRLSIFNEIKSIALGLDQLFKKHQQSQVKYHQVLSAVYQTLYDLFAEENIEALREIFGSVVNNQHALQTIRNIVIDFVEGIETAKTDRELNNVLNNFRIVDQPSRFESRLERVSQGSAFDGQLEISHSYAPKPNFEEGDTVNVVLRIKDKDIAALRKTLQSTFTTYNLEEGELTGKVNNSGGHVSLLLRGKYTKALAELVAELNENLTKYSIHFFTSGEVKIVTPPDIRTSCSVLSELHATTVTHLQEMQSRLYDIAQDKGNNLPPLHITQGNAKIKPACEERLRTFHEATPQLAKYLENYELNLVSILGENDVNTCTQARI